MRSVYQRALGEAFDGLAPELRSYFGEVDPDRRGVGEGVFDVAGSSRRWMAPVLAWLGWRRVLFAAYGHDVPFRIANIPTDGGETLTAIRTVRFASGDRVLEDTMRIVDGRLHDFLGRRRGLEVRLHLRVVDGLLSMRSGRQWLRLGGLRIPLLPIATVTVDESFAEGLQHVDVRLRSPLLGEWFRYAGSFTYEYVDSAGD